MIPHICAVSHNPPASYGDCLRAAIASFFSVDDMETVPHFYMSGDDVTADALLRTWLGERGLRPFKFALGGNASVDDVFAMMDGVNHDVPYLLFCNVGGGPHVLICRNDKIIHNPAWLKSPIDGPSSDIGMWVIMVFVPIMGD